MVLFVLVLVAILLSMAGLAAGVILRGRPLQGTCSGTGCKRTVACDGCKRRLRAADAP